MGKRGSEMTECQGCCKQWHVSELDDLRDPLERVWPGDEMPAGECPDCGCAAMLIDGEAGTSKWKCPACGSTDVEIALPAWFRETQDGHLMHTSTDVEAEPLYWICNACDESERGAPDRNDAKEGEA